MYVDQPLGKGQTVPLTQNHAHYLFGVMRLAVGTVLSVFNGRDGEWDAEITAAAKKSGELTCVAQTRALQMPPDLWLVFAPIKKDRTDFIVEKATEMGAARIVPVQTEFTNSGRINRDRLQAHAVEAAEQCGGTFIPEVAEMSRLSRVLDEWPADRRILFCDEALVDDERRFDAAGDGPWAIFIGPEGGFSDAERKRLRDHPNAVAVSLGPRILRADTAAVAAMTVWQQKLGDWA